MSDFRLWLGVARSLQDVAVQGLARRSTQEDDKAAANRIFIAGTIVVALTLAIFLPILLFMSYTLHNVIPILAIVEDRAPPDYELVASEEAHDSEQPPSSKKSNAPPMDDEGELAGVPPSKPLTSSLKATLRHLYSENGTRSLFRGFRTWWLLNLASTLLSLLLGLIPFMPSPVADITAALLTLQLFTAWIHAVIAAGPQLAPGSSSSRGTWIAAVAAAPFPHFRQTLRTTALPMLLFAAATAIDHLALSALSDTFDMPRLDLTHLRVSGLSGYQAGYTDTWKALALVGTQVLLSALLIIPSHVVLVRVQASLLLLERGAGSAVVPFDRTFEVPGAGGKPYLSVVEAWGSLSWGAWVSLVGLYAKIFLLTFAVSTGMVAFVLVEYMVALLIIQK